MAYIPGLVISPQLSQLALRFSNKDYIAEKIFKTVEVPQLSGQYTVFDQDVTFRVFDDTMSAYASANQIDVKGTLAQFHVDTHALKAYVDPREVKQVGGQLPIRAIKVEALMNSMKLALEVRIQALLSDPTVFTQGETLSGTGQFSDYVNSDPRAKILDVKRVGLVDYNTAIMSRYTYNVLLQHTKIVDAIKYTRYGFDTAGILGQYLGIENILIGDALKATNKKGQNQALTPVWGKDIILAHIAPGQPSALMEKPSVGYLAVANTGGGLWRVYTGRNPEMGTAEGAELIKVESDHSPLVSAPTFAYRLTNAVA